MFDFVRWSDDTHERTVGSAVWKLIEKPRTVAQLRDAVVREFEVGAAECERDLLSLLESLARSGLVEVRDGKVA